DDPHECDFGHHGVDDAVFRDDPVDGDTAQGHAAPRMPTPKSASVGQNHATAIIVGSGKHTSVHACTAAPGNHVTPNQTIQKTILLHYCSPFLVCSRDCFFS